MKVCLPEEVINMTSEGKQSFISPYNKGHQCIMYIDRRKNDIILLELSVINKY
jgi:hypothetical protein